MAGGLMATSTEPASAGIHYGNRQSASNAEQKQLGFRAGRSAEQHAPSGKTERRDAQRGVGKDTSDAAVQAMAGIPPGETGPARSGDD
jgi:hypothetical protein